MSVLARYMSKEFLRIFALCEAVFVLLYTLIDGIDKVDNFMEVNASWGSLAAYFLYRVPLMAVQMMPAAVLIAVVIMFSILKKQNEVTALKACGISVLRFSTPVLVIGAVFCAVLFVFSEVVVPYTSSRAQEIWNHVVRRQDSTVVYTRDHIWLHGANSIYYIQHFDGGAMRMDQPAFYFFSGSFELLKEIHAESAVWTGSQWTARKGIVLARDPGGNYALKRFEEMGLPVTESPEAFLVPAKEPEEMSYWQLKRFAEQIESDGYDAVPYRVDMNLKLSFPFISLLMMLLGIPIALGIKKGGAPVSVSLGVGVCFIYLVTLGLLRSLGLSGVLPPWLAAWLANLMFGLIGIYMMMRLPS